MNEEKTVMKMFCARCLGEMRGLPAREPLPSADLSSAQLSNLLDVVMTRIRLTLAEQLDGAELGFILILGQDKICRVGTNLTCPMKEFANILRAVAGSVEDVSGTAGGIA